MALIAQEKCQSSNNEKGKQSMAAYKELFGNLEFLNSNPILAVQYSVQERMMWVGVAEKFFEKVFPFLELSRNP